MTRAELAGGNADVFIAFGLIDKLFWFAKPAAAMAGDDRKNCWGTSSVCEITPETLPRTRAVIVLLSMLKRVRVRSSPRTFVTSAKEGRCLESTRWKTCIVRSPVVIRLCTR